MKLISQVSREYKDKKFWVIISNHVIEKLGWKTGDDLELDVKGGKPLVEKEKHEHSVLKAEK